MRILPPGPSDSNGSRRGRPVTARVSPQARKDWTTSHRARRGDADRAAENRSREERSAYRARRETLAGPSFTLSSDAIRRYAYTDVYRNTIAYFEGALQELGFGVELDPVGTLVARNRGRASHCSGSAPIATRTGTAASTTGRHVVRSRGLPPERRARPRASASAISFLEEEGSSWADAARSRIVAQRVTEEELRETFRAVDDGRSFWEHAEQAGFEPARWRDAAHILDGLTGWIEMHIEQARSCRTPATGSESSAPSPDTSTPTWSSAVAATMPARP